MTIYWSISRFNLLKFFAYPTELVIILIKKFLEIGLLILFWNLIAKTSSKHIDFREIISYFLIAEGIKYVIMFEGRSLGKFLRKSIKDGSFSTYLIKPLKVIPYSYFTVLGQEGINILLSIFSIFLGLVTYPNLKPISLLFLGVFFVNAALISLAINLFEGALALVFDEVIGISNAIGHLGRTLSGAMIPLSFFPDNLRHIVELTPFPAMIFYPINSLKIQSINSELLRTISLSFF